MARAPLMPMASQANGSDGAPPASRRIAIEATRAAVLAAHASVGLAWPVDRQAARAIRAAEALLRSATAILAASPPPVVEAAAPAQPAAPRRGRRGKRAGRKKVEPDAKAGEVADPKSDVLMESILAEHVVPAHTALLAEMSGGLSAAVAVPVAAPVVAGPPLSSAAPAGDTQFSQRQRVYAQGDKLAVMRDGVRTEGTYYDVGDSVGTILILLPSSAGGKKKRDRKAMIVKEVPLGDMRDRPTSSLRAKTKHIKLKLTNLTKT